MPRIRTPGGATRGRWCRRQCSAAKLWRSQRSGGCVCCGCGCRALHVCTSRGHLHLCEPDENVTIRRGKYAAPAAEGLLAVDERSRKGRGEHKCTGGPARQRRLRVGSAAATPAGSNTQPGASPPPPRAALHAQGGKDRCCCKVIMSSGRRKVLLKVIILGDSGCVPSLGSAALFYEWLCSAPGARESPTVRGCERESRCRPPARGRALLSWAPLFSRG